MILKLKKYKVRISPDSAEINTLQAGDIVNRQYFDVKSTIYTLMYVDSVGVDVVDKDGVKKDSPYFIGQLIYGDEPKTGELLNFVRVTSLSNSARGGALYLTSSDSDSPYMDVIDVVDRDNAVFILSGTGGMTPPNSKVTHIQNTDEYFTEIISDLGGDGLLFSVPNGASKSKRDVVDPVLLGFMSIKPSKDTDMEIFGSTFKLKGGEYNDIFIPLDSSDMMGSHLPMDIHLTNIGSVGDSFYIKGLIFVSMASMTGFSNGVKVRVGQLSGVIDEHFGALDSYGAYFQKLYATKDVNIAGTLSAGSKDGQQAVFYVGKIRTNAFTNSLKIEMKDNPAEKYTYADNPVGIGEMYRSKKDTSFYANKDKLWHLIHAGSTVCFSMFVMSLHKKESVTLNIGENDIAVKMATNGWNRVYFYFSLPEDAENTVITIRDADVAFCAPQLEFGVHPTIYQPTDEVSLLDYGEGNPDYGMWATKGGFGGTIQNPVVSITEEGVFIGDAIQATRGGVKIDLKKTGISDAIDKRAIETETRFEIKEGQISSTVTQLETSLAESKTEVEKAQKAVKDAESIKTSSEQDLLNAKEELKKAQDVANSNTASTGQAKADAEQAVKDAQKKVDDAQVKANEAATEAAKAKAEADKAALVGADVTKKQTEITQTAEEIKTTATKVTTDAEAAEASATKATAEATKSATNAANAKKDALSAKTQATNAQTKALEAAAKAEEALASAGESSESYLKAKTEAELAVKEAEKATEQAILSQTKADLATEEAAKAKAEADKAALAQKDVTLKQTEIKQTASEIKLSAKEVSNNTAKATEASATATKKATEATSQAELAQVQATEATAKALEADKKAQEALASAGSSSTSYQNAKKEADKAKIDATTANTKALEAKKEADRSKAEADKALASQKVITEKEASINVTAENIELKATEVTKNAETATAQAELATKKATEATTASTNATKKATEADLKAKEADAKAQEALASAGSSSESYKSAKLEAEKANAEATKANAEATKATAEATKAKLEADKAALIEANVTAKETSINQTAESINLKATEVNSQATKAETEAKKAEAKATEANAKALEASKKADEAKASSGASSQSYKNAQAEATKAKTESDKATAEAAKAKLEADKAIKAQADVALKQTEINQTSEAITLTATEVSENSKKAIDASTTATAKANEASANATKAKADAATANTKAIEANKKAEEAKASAGTSSKAYQDAKAEAVKANADATKANAEATKSANEAAKAKLEADKATKASADIALKQTEINQTADSINLKAKEVSSNTTKAEAEAKKAQASATTAQTNATNATNKAKEAQANATKTANDATASAQSKADAQKKADEAKADALKANAEAKKAEADALKAKQEADKAALAQADVVKRQAQIETTAQGVTISAQEAKESADKASKAEASINVKAGEIVMEASSKAAEKAIDGLEIGGRNIIINSGNFIASDYWVRYTGNQPYVEGGLLKVLGGTSGSPRIRNRNVKSMIPYEEESVTWMLSFVYRGNGRVDVSGKSSSTLTEMNEQGGQYIGRLSDVSIDKIEDGFVRHVVKIETLTQTDTRKAGWLTYAIPIGEVFEFKTFKLEKGTKATDWSPAPEDVVGEAVSKSEAKLTVTANEIRGEVNANKKAADGSISSLNTRVSQTEDKISQTVTKTEYDANNKKVGEKLTKIEQDVDGVEIIAKSAEEKIDGLEIGGVNLMSQNTGDFKEGNIAPWSYFRKTGEFSIAVINKLMTFNVGDVAGWSFLGRRLNANIQSHTTYTMSLYMRSNIAYKDMVVRISYTNGTNEAFSSRMSLTEGQMTRCTFIFTTGDLKDIKVSELWIQIQTPLAKSIYEIEYIMLEEGNKPSLSWSPNPADIVQESVTKSEASIKVETDKITAQVNANKVDADGKITGLNTRVTQTEESITSKVSQTEYDANNKAVGTKISAIEQKSDSIELSVKNLGAGTNIIKGSYNWLWQSSDTGKNTISSYKDPLGNHVNKITISEASSRINRYTWLDNYEVFEKGEFYTVSFEYRTNISDANIDYYYRHYQNKIVIKLMKTGESWAKASGTFQIDKNITTPPETWKHLLTALFNNPKAGETLEVRSLMLERGMTATGYTPAWQDYGASLALTKDGITMIGSGGISLIGKVTFNMMAGADPNDYGTIIEGGTIKTKYLNVQQIVTDGITANTFKGKNIIVDTGTIGGWKITNNTIENTNIVLEANGGIKSKNGKWVLAQDGSAKFTSGEIGGWNINNAALDSDNILLDPKGGIKAKDNLWALNPDGSVVFQMGRIANWDITQHDIRIEHDEDRYEDPILGSVVITGIKKYSAHISSKGASFNSTISFFNERLQRNITSLTQITPLGVYTQTALQQIALSDFGYPLGYGLNKSHAGITASIGTSSGVSTGAPVFGVAGYINRNMESQISPDQFYGGFFQGMLTVGVYENRGGSCVNVRNIADGYQIKVDDFMLLNTSEGGTATLPANPKNGQIYIYKNYKHTLGSIKVAAGSGHSITSKGKTYSAFHGSVMHVLIFTTREDIWLTGWLNV